MHRRLTLRCAIASVDRDRRDDHRTSGQSADHEMQEGYSLWDDDSHGETRTDSPVSARSAAEGQDSLTSQHSELDSSASAYASRRSDRSRIARSPADDVVRRRGARRQPDHQRARRRQPAAGDLFLGSTVVDGAPDRPMPDLVGATPGSPGRRCGTSARARRRCAPGCRCCCCCSRRRRSSGRAARSSSSAMTASCRSCVALQIVSNARKCSASAASP